MKIISLDTGKEITLGKTETVSCTVGNFDGVHLGHAALLAKAVEKGACDISAVWTFSDHTRKDAKLISSPEQRAALFKAAGIDVMIVEDFDAIKGLSPEEFATDILYEKCRVRRAVCGTDFRFGKNAAGTADDLSRLLGKAGAEVFVVEPVLTSAGEVISSSLIREAVASGDMKKAAEMLGRNYSICFPVCEGQHLARKIGIPTINQLFPEKYVLPAFGVYACSCNVDGVKYKAVSNVGVRPTVFDVAPSVNCETHLIGFSGDLYGKNVTVEFIGFIRPEKKFGSIEELAAAIRSDLKTAERLL